MSRPYQFSDRDDKITSPLYVHPATPFANHSLTQCPVTGSRRVRFRQARGPPSRPTSTARKRRNGSRPNRCRMAATTGTTTMRTTNMASQMQRRLLPSRRRIETSHPLSHHPRKRRNYIDQTRSSAAMNGGLSRLPISLPVIHHAHRVLLCT